MNIGNDARAALTALASVDRWCEIDVDDLADLLAVLAPGDLAVQLPAFRELREAVAERSDLIAGFISWADIDPDLTGMYRDIAAEQIVQDRIDDAINILLEGDVK